MTDLPSITIPAVRELALLPQWVAWQYEERDGKKTKIPYTATTQRASSTDPATWATFDEVCEAAGRYRRNGVGFVFSPDDKYVGIDLDACIGPETGLMESWAEEIVAQFDSYTEYSPSGWGVKIWAKGELPSLSRHKTNVHPELPLWSHGKSRAIEVYDRSRYYTVTGKPWPDTRRHIVARQEEIDSLLESAFVRIAPSSTSQPSNLPKPAISLSDEELLNAARASRNGVKFSELYDYGEFTSGQESEADSALVYMLAFMTKDPAQIDRLFRNSKLMRAKWDAKRGDSTWGANEIANAIATVKETYTPPGRKVKASLAWGKIRPEVAPPEEDEEDDEAEPAKPKRFKVKTRAEFMLSADPQWLVDGILPFPGQTLLYGPSGLGKSFVGLDLACSVATGLQWLGHDVVQGDVLYIAGEGQAGFKKRLASWESARNVQAEQLYWLTDAPQFMEASEVEAVLEALAIAGANPALIIIDTLARTLVGGDENSAQDVGKYLASMEALKAMAGANIMVIHHSGHAVSERPRGSSSIMGAADTLIGLTGDKASMRLVLTCEKQKDGPEFSQIGLRLTLHSDSLVVESDQEVVDPRGLSATAKDLLEALSTCGEEGLSTNVWESLCTGITRRSFYRAKGDLAQMGLIRNSGSQTKPFWEAVK